MRRLNRWCWILWGLTLLAWMSGAPNSTAVELTRIRQRGTLRVAVKDNLRPMGFRSEQGQLQGFEIDLAQRLAQDLWGRPDAALLVPVPNAERLSAVVSGTVDLAIANLAATDNRRRLVDFSRPYYLSGIGVLTPQPEIRHWRDLGGRSVGLLQGSRAIAIVQSALPGVNLVGVSSYQAAQEALNHQAMDAFVGDAVVLQGWAQQNSSYRYLPQGLATHPLAIALPKGNPSVSLRQWVDQRIQVWQQEGWLQERQQYWGLSSVSRSP